MPGVVWQNFIVPDDDNGRAEAISALVRHFAPHIFADDEGHPQVSVLSGGLTNQLYKVSRSARAHPSKCGSAVVRVYGKETDRIISRTAELFWQSQFLKTFGKCQNALVYEFLEGYGDCTPEDLPRFWREIATTLARFHARGSAILSVTLPYATESIFCEDTIFGWLSQASSSDTRAALQQKGGDTLTAAYDAIGLKTRVADDFAWVAAEIREMRPHLLIGLCHNDLLAPNVMCKRDAAMPGGLDPQSIRLIDFEYAHRNFLLYDIANHFNEYAGFECAWSQCPLDADATRFLRVYFEELHSAAGGPESTIAGTMPSEQEIAQALRAVRIFQCVSHLAWGVWSVIQAAYSAIDFAYLPYAIERFNGVNVVRNAL